MSYTNTELVRHHLPEPFPTQSRIENQAVVLTGDESIRFYGGEIDVASLSVKSIRSRTPKRVGLTLDSESVILTACPLIPGSVIVASDSSMGTVYVENEDYVVDYSKATLSLKSTGGLTPGMTLVVWYLNFELYTRGTDYSVDAVGGTIRRLAGGAIAPGEQVYLDYLPKYAGVTEQLIESAVAEANGLIERTVDPSRQFGADQVLQLAATCRALEIVCRTSVARDLMGATGNERTASVWMKLADHYAGRSEDLLKTFRPPASTISRPTLS